MSLPDPIMKAWQQKLIDAAAKEGKPNPLPRYGADGLGGQETQTAILDFQARHGLATTGQFDEPTKALLNPTTGPDYTLGRSLIPIILSMILKGGPDLSSIPSIAAWINNSSILGLLRNGLISAGTFITTTGFISGTQWEQIVGVIMMLVSATLSWIANQKAESAKLIAKAVDAHPDITVVPTNDNKAKLIVAA